MFFPPFQMVYSYSLFEGSQDTQNLYEGAPALFGRAIHPFLYTSRMLPQRAYHPWNLTIASLDSFFHVCSLHSILSTVTMRGMSDLVNPLLKALPGLPSSFSPDKALPHMASLFSHSSSSPSAPASPTGLLDLHWTPQTSSQLWAFAVIFFST